MTIPLLLPAAGRFAAPGFRSPIIFAIALLTALLINQALSRIAPALAASVTGRFGTAGKSKRFLRTRRAQTFLSLGVATSRVIIVVAALAVAWNYTNPTTAPIAIIGAGTVFAVTAGATFVPILRDLTYGFIMIAEHWFNVGDHVVIEPLPQLGGVVEQITLRATKIRSVNGEVIWVHNQHIQAVRVTTAASHTLAIETFVTDPKLGTAVIDRAIKVIPTGPITIPLPPVITEIKKLDDELWRITAICEVTPFREWIIDKFAVDVIRESDALAQKSVIVHGPVVYYADATAEKRYRRSVRAHNPHLATASRPRQKAS